MYSPKWVLVLIVAASVACNSRRFVTPAVGPQRAAEIDREVQEFAATVAHDVTQDGPAAWRKHFSESPAFFMASEGHLQFPDSASAIAGIQELTRAIKHIDLKWSEVKVDPLTPDLAGMRAAWHEVAELPDGKRVEESGYFTGIAEHRNGRWQFRNAHWSVPPVASPAVP